MPRSKIAGIGMYVPEKVVTNNELKQYMDTDDQWIQERTGIQERHYAHRTEETTTTMAVEAASIAIKRAGISAADIDFIVFAWWWVVKSIHLDLILPQEVEIFL